MYDDFIVFEPGTQRPPSPKVPGLLFVTCDQPSGRTQEQVKPRLRQHVMRTHLHRDRKSKAPMRRTPKPVSACGHLDDPLAAAVPDHSSCSLPPNSAGTSSYWHTFTPNDATDMHLGDPRAILGDSFGTLSLPFETGYDAKTVLKWMVVGHDSVQAERFKTACTFYLHGLWRWATVRKLAFDGLAVYVCRKRLELAGNSVLYRCEYLQRKCGLIQAIQQQIIQNDNSADNGMLFAIVALASCLVLDSELQASNEQLVALRSICRLNNSSLVCWVYLWLVDLRLALFAGSGPVLDCHIPQEVGKPLSQHKDAMSIEPDAMRLALLSPKTKTTFAPPRTEELFSKLIRLCSMSENLGATADPPLYELYEIEFQLRTVHACVLEEPPSPTRMCTELTVLALQLSVWIAARHFAPLTEQSVSTVLHRAGNLLSSVSPIELLHAWISSAQADSLSLLWVLTLFTLCFAADDDELVPFPGVVYVTNHLSITTKRKFLYELQQWPPQKAWNGPHYSNIWTKIIKFKGPSPNTKMSRRKGKEQIACEGQHNSRPKRPFFGVLQFWDI